MVTSDARHGDSIAVNGVCLTVVDVDGDIFTADVMKETFDRASLGSLAPGEPVNLERAATAATRLGGHIVQGHVDGVGAIVSKAPGERLGGRAHLAAVRAWPGTWWRRARSPSTASR